MTKAHLNLPIHPKNRLFSLRSGIIVSIGILVAVSLAWLGTEDSTQVWIMSRRSTPELESIVRQDPNSPWSAYVLATRYEKSGHVAEASKLLEHARQTAPDSFEIRYALGRVYLTLHQPETAEPELKRATELAPDNATVHRYLGIAQSLNGELPLAKESEKRATTLDPKDAEAWYQYGLLFTASAGDEAEGRPFLAKAVSLQPGNGAYELAYGRSLADGVQFSDALPHLRLAAQALPDDSSAHFFLGLSLHRNGKGGADQSEAVAELKRAIELSSEDYKSHYELGSIYEDSGDYKNAREQFQITSRLFPGFQEAWFHLSRACNRTGHTAEAAQANARFAALRQEHVEFQKLVHRLQQHPEDVPARIRIGQLFEKQGKLNAAIIQYMDVIDREPNNRTARSALNRLEHPLTSQKTSGTEMK